MQTDRLAVILVMTMMLVAGIACDGPDPPERPVGGVDTVVPALSPTEAPVGTAVPEPGLAITTADAVALLPSLTIGSAATSVPVPSLTKSSSAASGSESGPARLPIDGATWILESVDGQPLIAGTHATLTFNGPQFGGFDGCNHFGGRHESGKPVVSPDGEISPPPFGGTAQLCVSPSGIMEQADRYLDAMTRQAKARAVDDRLHVVDSSGEVVLVFVRQISLPGKPINLAGTSWRLVDYGTYGEGPATLLFLDSRAATGTTTCRDYTVGYTATMGRIRMPYKGMSGSTEMCSRDAVKREHRFVEDFGWANEYSVDQVEGFERLVVRTSKGKTLMFERLPEPAGAIFGGGWRLIRFMETRTGGSGMTRPDSTDVVGSAEITATFTEGAVEGSLGCHSYSYSYRAVGGDEATLIGGGGTISIDGAELATENSCDNRAYISPQQRQYLDFLAAAERYHVFGDRLVILTRVGDGLVFQAVAGNQ